MANRKTEPYKTEYVDIFRYMLNPDYKPPIEELPNPLTCDCGKVYKQKQSLINHKKKCTHPTAKKIASYDDAMDRVSELIKEELTREPDEYKAEARLYMRFIDELQQYSCTHDTNEFERLVNTFIDCALTAHQNAYNKEHGINQTPIGEFTLNINLNASTDQIEDTYDTTNDDYHFVHHWPLEDENSSKAQQFLQSALTTENVSSDLSGNILHIEHRWVDESELPSIKSGEHSITKDSNGDCRYVCYWSRPVMKKKATCSN